MKTLILNSSYTNRCVHENIHEKLGVFMNKRLTFNLHLWLVRSFLSGFLDGKVCSRNLFLLNKKKLEANGFGDLQVQG